MEQQEYIDKLKPILAPYAKDQEALQRLTRDTSFIRDLKINSANLVDVVLDVEEAFDVEIDNESMEKMLTVGAAIDIVQAKQDAR
ncbi:phosphopantetheine-binding protein [Taibaiella koreensis]|uniref:phosphopantetheine-binding protein n=1 Tax=Taibaiella koreensis TaxID=1268548 RepID=UPI000E59ACEF|nr:phosphopantetheine-binding protein [Taibaiella koreensis]